MKQPPPEAAHHRNSALENASPMILAQANSVKAAQSQAIPATGNANTTTKPNNELEENSEKAPKPVPPTPQKSQSPSASVEKQGPINIQPPTNVQPQQTTQMAALPPQPAQSTENPSATVVKISETTSGPKSKVKDQPVSSSAPSPTSTQVAAKPAQPVQVAAKSVVPVTESQPNTVKSLTPQVDLHPDKTANIPIANVQVVDQSTRKDEKPPALPTQSADIPVKISAVQTVKTTDQDVKTPAYVAVDSPRDLNPPAGAAHSEEDTYDDDFDADEDEQRKRKASLS